MGGRKAWSETDRALFRKNRGVLLKTSGVCMLCGQPIDRGVKFPHPLSGTVDHILPVAKGGRSTMDNLQVAHLICNRMKSDKITMDTYKEAHQEDLGNRNLPQYFDWFSY